MRFLDVRLLLLASASACIAPLDLLGQDESVNQASQNQPNPIADDKIEDKHPEYDPAQTVTLTYDQGCSATLNLSGAVTKLDVVPFDGADAPLASALFPTIPAANAALADQEILPSMEVVNQSLKAFNDGLYAAIELGVEDGVSGSPIQKLALLTDLANALNAGDPQTQEAQRYVSTAVALGGGQPPANVATDSLRAAFEADTIHSRPIGFYTWSPKLSQIFEQDRFLQNHFNGLAPMSFGALVASAVTLSANADLASRYGAVLDLYAGLTNPYYDLSARELMPFAPDASALGRLGSVRSAFLGAHPGVSTDGASDGCTPALALFPGSDSPENKLIRSLSCPAGALPSGNLLDLIVDAVRSGKLDLTPTATSGFYDRQLYALQTLLVPDQAPEKDHLFLTANYKKKLVETFKSLLIETRETHVKQVSIPMIGGSSSAEAEPILFDVYPQFPVEPFPTFYLRTARAYVFLSNLLTSVLGSAFLNQSTRVLESGHRGRDPLAAELQLKTSVLYGLHAATAASLGVKDQRNPDERALFPNAEKDAAAFVKGWRDDPDVAYDPRVIVPSAIDGGTVTYWAIIGVKPVRSLASFYSGFLPRDIVPGGFCKLRSITDRKRVLYSFANVQVTARLGAPPLTRDEFRALCDANKTEAAIIAAIQNR